MRIVHGQTWEEWTHQRKTQIKYLVEQIAALKVYVGYAKEGYEVVDKGMHVIQGIKKGDFDLHKDFFSSLKEVNPRINRSVKVADIIVIQLRIIKDVKATMKSISVSRQFTKKELDYCSEIFEGLLRQCAKDMDELFQVITSGELQMKDNERLQRINKLHKDMQDKFGFCTSFSRDATLLALQRRSEQNDINLLKKVYDLPVMP